MPTDQEMLLHTIQTTPIIDNHAHPLLTLKTIPRYPLLSITTEAQGDAIHASLTSLAHLRGVAQLSRLLSCEPTWEAVVNAIEQMRTDDDYDAWVNQCLAGIETVLVDDGLDNPDDVFPYTYLSKHTRTPCKRIVRIERLVGELVEELDPADVAASPFDTLDRRFEDAIANALRDSEVVGFKSVICYRTGLAIPRKADRGLAQDVFDTAFLALVDPRNMSDSGSSPFRLSHPGVNEYFVHRTAYLIAAHDSPRKKPIQFHTGLGDNDITLTTASPAHLQEFIREHPAVPIVLLHASYPFTREAGYLAMAYANVYADIGEVFPFLSQGGQETVVRQILELCPWSKVLWSTDGHWSPETYYLAHIQIREVLQKVLGEYARKQHITWQAARQLVKDILFTNSNNLYHLNLTFTELPMKFIKRSLRMAESQNIEMLTNFLDGDPSIQYLRIYWNDMTALQRMRAIPMHHVWTSLIDKDEFSIGITQACMGLLQNDHLIGVSATGEYRLHPDFRSLRHGPREGHISGQGEFRDQEGSPVSLCPRTLFRGVVEDAERHGIRFRLGFEIELVLMRRDPSNPEKYVALDHDGHAWSVAQMLDHPVVPRVIEKAVYLLRNMNIHIEQVHPESAPGQFELVLPHEDPLRAIDTLLHVRQVVSTIATAEGYRMTLHPKPFFNAPGTAAHVHISVWSYDGEKLNVYQHFYAGILRHLRAIAAFTCSNVTSYERLQDGCWAGGRWVAWGTQNRETALRKIEGSHWEFKALDGLANPYLAMAAILSAGLGGILKKEELVWGDCEVDPANLTENDKMELGVEEMLPASLPEALEALRNDDELVGAMGRDLVERYIAVKEAEIALLKSMLPPERRCWIIERY